MAKKYTLTVLLLKRILIVLVGVLLFSITILPSFLNNSDRVRLNHTSNEKSNESFSNEIINPCLYGQDEQGKPYTLTAKSGHKADDIITLSDISGKIMADKGQETYTVTCKAGEYKQDSDIVFISGDIMVTNQLGYKAITESAIIDYYAGTIYTLTPIYIEIGNLSLNADTLEMPSTDTLVFKKNVKVIIK